MTAHLIDIAVFQTVDDWPAVAADGIGGASVKVTQATNYINPKCAAQVAGAKSVGIATGGYHFGDPRYDAIEQARFFLANARRLGLFADDGELAPMYDAENWDGNFRWQSRGQLSDHIGAWLDVLAQETDVQRALVYGSLSWWGSMLAPADWATEGVEVLNWIAVYNGQPGNLQGWSHPNDAIHQHTSAGRVPGVTSGNVDKNVTLRGREIIDITSKGTNMGLTKEDFDVEVEAFDPNGPATADGKSPVEKWRVRQWLGFAAFHSLAALKILRDLVDVVARRTDVSAVSSAVASLRADVSTLRSELAAARTTLESKIDGVATGSTDAEAIATLVDAKLAARLRE